MALRNDAPQPNSNTTPRARAHPSLPSTEFTTSLCGLFYGQHRPRASMCFFFGGTLPISLILSVSLRLTRLYGPLYSAIMSP